MILVTAQVENFRSIDTSSVVAIDPNVTVMVGQNESGKTGFLQALNFCRPVEPGGGFDLGRDYPRKNASQYRARSDAKPATVVTLVYEVTPNELATLNAYLGLPLLESVKISTTHHYDNTFTIGFKIDESPYIQHLLQQASLPPEVVADATGVRSIRALLKLFQGVELTANAREFVTKLTERFRPEATTWQNLLEYEIWTKYLKGWLPKFFYFDDYYLLPGKVNLKSLAERAGNATQLTADDKTVLGLLDLAGVSLSELTTPQGYEQIKSRLERLQNSITDRIFEYWTQNQELEVEFDIREDPTDVAPFHQGANLYIRIRNRRHRVTIPFSQRSKGFIWFFSFIIWFDTIQRQLGESDGLVLLLDEPGLNLHALAQRDFLRYIDSLTQKRHQIIYSTHSPFMIPTDRLQQVRMVEDRSDAGTVITADVSQATPETVFPVQAAIGYSVIQELFSANRNLLVEGPADLIYLKLFSAALEKSGRVCLRDDVAIVPMGGLDRLATFLALQGTPDLELVVIHNWAGQPDPRVGTIVEQNLIKPKSVLNYGQFRDVKAKGKTASEPASATQIEDLLNVGIALKLFNETFSRLLPSPVKESELPTGHGIVDRLARYLAEQEIELRPHGGYNRDLVATHFATHPPKSLDKESLARFEELFKKVNGLYSRS